MDSVSVRAYGKINLILKVGGKRPDGRHDVLTVMQKVSVFDTVTVTKSEIPGIAIGCSDPSLATEDNLAYKAASAYFEKAGLDPSVSIYVEKDIPVTAGMAGGSSDAGATLTALEQLFGALGFDGIYGIAATLGADVPFFVYEDKTMLGSGTGTVLTPFPSFTEDTYGVFVTGVAEKPSTGEMYRRLDETKGEGSDLSPNAESSLRKATENGDVREFLSALENDFELCNPHAEKVSKELCGLGAQRCVLCGSGPTVCGIFTDMERAEKASEAIPYKTFVCKITGN